MSQTDDTFERYINAAYRNKDEPTFRALKALREEMRRKPLFHVKIQTENGTIEGDATEFVAGDGLVTFRDTIFGGGEVVSFGNKSFEIKAK